ncbi:hypothetical protein [Peribacillus huizhouensis]|uniref:Uncharacterized protein n=1 Tax=Peribacillus huizhouensis TaxID=1501239 RepID=A0ABR6CR86_9BACI|nr:hypothetical protein [Peribacillus huizhouensis]MBA9027544.1 hypothetical protein [Peribacillus huizhouensis]
MTQNNVQTFAEQTESNSKDIAELEYKFIDAIVGKPADKPSKSAEEILRDISELLAEGGVGQ